MIDSGARYVYFRTAESTAPLQGRRMTTAMNETKKQWVKPGIRQLEGAEAEKARRLIYSNRPEAEKDHCEPDLKRRTG
jgi:hypothetical protein